MVGKNLFDAETKWFMEIVMDADIIARLEVGISYSANMESSGLVWKQQLFFNFGVIRTQLAEVILQIWSHPDSVGAEVILQIWSYRDGVGAEVVLQ